MKILALVTARGGSKGFPGKNLALLGGTPLVRWSHSLLARFRDIHPDSRVFLSTDSPEIAAAWPQMDQPHRLRPSDLASDTASSLSVIDFEISMADREGFKSEALLLIQPTSPLIALADLENAHQHLFDGAGAVVGMVPLDHPIQWTWTKSEDGLLNRCFPPDEATRRQDLHDAFRPAGFYLARRCFLETHRSFFVDGLTQSVIVPSERGVDIDHPVDLWMAEGILNHRMPSGPTVTELPHA